MSRLIYSLTILIASLCVVAQCRPMDSSEEQESRRVARGRYKMGYMFGKRADIQDKSPSLLLHTLVGKAVSVEDLSHDFQTDPALAQRVARHLDTNGDGYVSVREVL